MKITIPPAVLEAGARAMLHAETPESMDWNYSIPAVRQEYLDKARAAFEAMVEAWPGMKMTPWWEFTTHKRRVDLILPLTEPDNADAL